MNTNTTALKTETIRDFPEVRAHLARLRSIEQERLAGAVLGMMDYKQLQKGLDVSSHVPWKARRGRPIQPIVQAQVEEVLFPFWPEVLDTFKATGPGWQTRINTVLRTALAEGKI